MPAKINQPFRMVSLGAIAAPCQALILCLGCSTVFAQSQPPPSPSPSPPVEAPPDTAEVETPSPWILAPVFTSSPKLGTTLGATAAYLYSFDPKSRPSIFAVTGQYSNTDSVVAALLAKTSFDADQQRLSAALSFGNIKNDYDNYLGTGVPLRNDAALKSFITRYLYRVKGSWFIGAQGIYQNFTIAGESATDEAFLDILGISSYKSGALGLVVYHDSRDNEFKPSKGWVLSINNLAYREALGGEQDFGVYRVDFRKYIPQGDGNVFAFRQLNHLTKDAPTQNLSPVQLRGYKTGQFTGTYMAQFEGEARIKLAERWTATAFAGVACTYGNGKDCSHGRNVFPMAGAGVQFVLKPAVGIVLNLEYAQGKDGDSGVILKTGYTF